MSRHDKSGDSDSFVKEALFLNQERGHFAKSDWETLKEVIYRPELSFNFFLTSGLKPGKLDSPVVDYKLGEAFSVVQELREEEPITSLLQRDGKPAQPEGADVCDVHYYSKRTF